VCWSDCWRPRAWELTPQAILLGGLVLLGTGATAARPLLVSFAGRAAQDQSTPPSPTLRRDELYLNAVEQAQQLLGYAGNTDSKALGAHYNSTLLTMQTAICHTEAGQPRRAAELYQQWLSANRFSPRDYGYFLSSMASSLALAGEPDEAARTRLISIPLARETNSGRTMQELAKVLTTLTPWRTRAAVRELQEATSIAGHEPAVTHSAMVRMVKACHSWLCGSA